jgi:hypothetical protein
MELIIQVANVLFLINGILALHRWNQVEDKHHPFLAYLVISMIFAFQQHFTNWQITLSSSIFVLLEGLLLLSSLYAWGYMARQSKFFRPILALFVIVWIAEMLWLWDIKSMILYYRLFYSFVLVIVAINGMNSDIVQFKGNLLRYAPFLVASAIVLYFTYNVLLESFYIAGLQGPSFGIKRIFKLASMIIFTIAVLWIPRKK